MVRKLTSSAFERYGKFDKTEKSALDNMSAHFSTRTAARSIGRARQTHCSQNGPCYRTLPLLRFLAMAALGAAILQYARSIRTSFTPIGMCSFASCLLLQHFSYCSVTYSNSQLRRKIRLPICSNENKT